MNILLPGIKTYGIENHQYALKKSVKCQSKLIQSEYYKIPDPLLVQDCNIDNCVINSTGNKTGIGLR